MHTRVKILVLITITAAFAGSMAGQAPPDTARVFIGGPGPGLPALSAKGGAAAIRVEDMDVEPAKGAPFCATVTTEHTQTFADGNRIHTTDNSSICRDSEGRTRREASLNLLGAAPQASAPKLITIMDPVAGFRYMLDSENKVAHRMPIEPPARVVAAMKAERASAPEIGGQVMMYQRADTAGPNIVVNGDMVFKKAGQAPDEPTPTIENLADQMIDGIHANGTRMTTTIPAGKMGNDQPILVTSEQWYSPELKATILTKHNDPWAGELKTQFTNVNTSEPDPSLFLVPGDYKVVEGKAFMIQKPLPASASPPQ